MNIVMDKSNYFQDYKSQYSTVSTPYHYAPRLQQLNSSYSAGQNYFPQQYYMTPETMCADCLVTYAPTWRIRYDGKKVCNACGLYRRKHGCMRPLEVTKEGRIRTKRRNNFQPKICANCGVNESTCWRRVDGERHCNACGLYAKINGRPRSFKYKNINHV